MEGRNRKQESAYYEDEWYAQQCGHCVYWVPLAAPLGSDWGACTNALSPFDGKIMFEHDGCQRFEAAADWAEVPIPDTDP